MFNELLLNILNSVDSQSAIVDCQIEYESYSIFVGSR